MKNNSGIQFTPTGAKTLPDVLACQMRCPGFIRQHTEQEHIAAIENRCFRHYTVLKNGQFCGFFLLSGIGSEAGCIRLEELAAAEPESGMGKNILKMLIPLVFKEMKANRF